MKGFEQKTIEQFTKTKNERERFDRAVEKLAKKKSKKKKPILQKAS